VCGIAGFAGWGDEAILKTMAGRMSNRGPDGEGLWHAPDLPVFLGHRRLAVIDVAGGAQPMWNEDGQVGIVFNGEIYNHRELRALLEAAGHRFRSDHSDTEVLIHGFEEWGDGLPERLNGMFAFAILDRRARRLFLARDRLGKKPLFYADGPDLFAFASEITALLAHPGVPAEVDGKALQKFFAHCFFPAPHTPYKAIRKLPAGHWLMVDLGSRRRTLREYWRFRIEPVDEGRSDDDLAEELRHLLDQAVRRRLDADVPLGVLLSGGVDSSAVLALAAAVRGRAGIDAFSIGFSEASYDESPHACRMAGMVGARHHLLTCNLPQARAEVPGLLARLDEPLADSAILPTWMVCRHARRHVTVALSGDGADELFAGYDTFKALGASHLYRRLVPGALHGAVRGLAGMLPKADSDMSLDFKAERWLRGVGFPPQLWNPLWLAALDPAEIGELFGQRIEVEDLYSEVLDRWSASEGDTVDRCLEFFTAFYLQDDILVKADRAGMLEGLELRSPFLDPEVVEFARRLPNRHKLHRGERKVILKKALRGLVPDDLLNRRKKGFRIPLAQWLRDMAPPASPLVPGLDNEWLMRRWELHRTRRQDCRNGLWCWLALHYHFTGKATPP
jgi:asparagine synthase (glutamine-hydrolysing)